MNLRPEIHTNGFLRVSLAIDKLDTLTNYILLPVNIKGIKVVIKVWII